MSDKLSNSLMTEILSFNPFERLEFDTPVTSNTEIGVLTYINLSPLSIRVLKNLKSADSLCRVSNGCSISDSRLANAL